MNTVLFILVILAVGCILYLYSENKGLKKEVDKLNRILKALEEADIPKVPCKPVILKATNYFKMATNHIKIIFNLCSPTPIGGYIIKYRPVGDVGPYRNAPANPYTASPAEWDDLLDPADTVYEGYIQSDCGDGNLGGQVTFETEPVVPPTPCEGVCGKYKAVGEATDGTNFTWVDCDGVEQSTFIALSAVFFFCTCDDDPQYSDANVTVLRVQDCVACNTFINNSGVTQVCTYVDCNGDAHLNENVVSGGTICVYPGSLTGPGAGFMTDLGPGC